MRCRPPGPHLVEAVRPWWAVVSVTRTSRSWLEDASISAQNSQSERIGHPEVTDPRTWWQGSIRRQVGRPDPRVTGASGRRFTARR